MPKIMLNGVNYSAPVTSQSSNNSLSLDGGKMNKEASIMMSSDTGIGTKIALQGGEYASSYYPAYITFESSPTNNEYYNSFKTAIHPDVIAIISQGDDYDEKITIKEGSVRCDDFSTSTYSRLSSQDLTFDTTYFTIALFNNNDKFKGMDISATTVRPHSYSGSSSNSSPYMDLGENSANMHKWKNIYAQNGVIQTSDRTQKTNVANLETELTKKFIMGLIPSSYGMVNGTSGRTHWGLIAQDVEELLNDIGLTSYDFAGLIKSSKKIIKYEDENGNKLKDPIEEIVENEYNYSLRYDEFIAPIITVIQEQERTINKQQKEIEQIKKDIEKIYNQIA